MQFTELFLNPSGGTTAEGEESAAKEKSYKSREEGKDGGERKEVEERGWRQPWRQLFCPGGAPPSLRFLYVSLPGSPVPISPLIHRLCSFSGWNTYTRKCIGVSSNKKKRKGVFPLRKIVRTDFPGKIFVAKFRSMANPIAKLFHVHSTSSHVSRNSSSHVKWTRVRRNTRAQTRHVTDAVR